MTTQKNQIQGMYTNEEFQQMYDNAHSKSIKLSEGKARITKGATTNYYVQHSDGSWTNYDCKTSY